MYPEVWGAPVLLDPAPYTLLRSGSSTIIHLFAWFSVFTPMEHDSRLLCWFDNAAPPCLWRFSQAILSNFTSIFAPLNPSSIESTKLTHSTTTYWIVNTHTLPLFTLWNAPGFLVVQSWTAVSAIHRSWTHDCFMQTATIEIDCHSDIKTTV